MFGLNKRRKINENPESLKPEGTKIIKPRNEELTVQVTHSGGCRVNTAMSTHIGTREYQQDAAYVSEPLFDGGVAFGILCDGMGGMSGGERASSDVVAFMANKIAAVSPGDDIPAFFESCAAEANEMVLEINRQSGQEAGTTLVSLIIRGDELYWLSVGDSRIYVIRGGEIAQVSRDHNFALELKEMVREGLITQEQADIDPRKDALVSYIGAPVLEMVDVSRGSFKLRYGDILLLCSDGLTKILTDGEILDVLKNHGGNMDGAARSLPLAAFDAGTGSMDNTSVVLMQYLSVE